MIVNYYHYHDCWIIIITIVTCPICACADQLTRGYINCYKFIHCQNGCVVKTSKASKATLNNTFTRSYYIGILGGGGWSPPKLQKLPINEAQISSLFEHPFTSAPSSCIIFLRHCTSVVWKHFGFLQLMLVINLNLLSGF